jgi:hypothetical protein
MNRKAGTLSMVWTEGARVPLARYLFLLVLGLAAVMLAAASIYHLMSVLSPGASSGVAAGVEAASARWSALGAHYAPDYEAIATASSARWSALGEYLSKAKARAADTARWNALGAHYAPDYEAIATVSSARWSALGAHYAPDYEAIAAVNSARWTALAESYAARAIQGQ